MDRTMIPNGDFSRDTDQDGVADHWQVTGREQGQVACCLEAEGEGGNTQKITVISAEAAKMGCVFGIASDRFAVPAGGLIALRAELRAENISTCHILFFLRDAEGRPLAIPLIPSAPREPAETDAWDWRRAYPALPQTWRDGSWERQPYSAVLAVPPETATAEVHVWFRYSGCLWISNVSVTRQEEPVP